MPEKMLEEQVEFQKKGLAREPRASGMQVRGARKRTHRGVRTRGQGGGRGVEGQRGHTGAGWGWWAVPLGR